jgi:hypothetical protein
VPPVSAESEYVVRAVAPAGPVPSHASRCGPSTSTAVHSTANGVPANAIVC